MAPSRTARILVVDDSAVMRSLVRSAVITDERLEVVGTASNGSAALEAMDVLRPDLVVLDVEMPIMDGLSTLKQMRLAGRRVPVIMCSSLTQRGAKVTIEALSSGASDYVAKPTGQGSREASVQALARDLVPRILVLTGLFRASASASPHSGPRASLLPPTSPVPSPSRLPGRTTAYSPSLSPLTAPRLFASNPGTELISITPRVLVIGVSTGGPAALETLLPALPASFPIPVLLVQHMPELFTKMLAERLDTRCALHVTEAVDGEPAHAGTIFIAKGNWHLEVHLTPGLGPPILRLTQSAPEHYCRPAVDVLFRSAVATYGSGTLGVILTGMGSDGLDGCRLIRQHGGAVLAQDEATSVVWGMPAAVAQANLAQRVLPLSHIAPEIIRLSNRVQREAFELREPAV
jgi:two-component system, chemotaxis family, protein-glutamate methylesterase/glutaminase